LIFETAIGTLMRFRRANREKLRRSVEARSPARLRCATADLSSNCRSRAPRSQKSVNNNRHKIRPPALISNASAKARRPSTEGREALPLGRRGDPFAARTIAVTTSA
jgi:hypothetical protein